MKKTDTKKRDMLKVMFGVLFFGNAILCASCTKKIAKINHKKCTKCRLCESVCSYGAITFQNGKIKVDKTKCTGCAKCVNACVYEAISV